MSSLAAIDGFKLESDLVQKIMKDYTERPHSKTIVICWIPNYVNIQGNERANVAAKSALSSSITNMKLSGRELISHTSQFCLD